MDSVAPGVAPQRSDFNAYAIYFLAWIFVGNLIALPIYLPPHISLYLPISP